MIITGYWCPQGLMQAQVAVESLGATAFMDLCAAPVMLRTLCSDLVSDENLCCSVWCGVPGRNVELCRWWQWLCGTGGSYCALSPGSHT